MTASPLSATCAADPAHSNIADRILDCFPSGSYALGALLRLLDIVDPTSRTVDELKKLNLPSGVDITIKI